MRVLGLLIAIAILIAMAADDPKLFVQLVIVALAIAGGVRLLLGPRRR